MANFNFNKVILGGRLTADPEPMRTQQGVSTTRFSIAVNRRAKEQQTDFINCVAWRQTADLICQYFRKGSCICVVGSIQVREWTDNAGNKRYATEVIASEVTFVDSNSKTSEKPNLSTQDTVKFENVAPDDDLPF